MQDHGQDHSVAAVTMNASHHPAKIPLLMGNSFNRGIGASKGGVIKGIDIKAGNNKHNQEKEGQATQIIEWIVLRTEDIVC